MERNYTVSVRDYIHEGYDGYDILIKCPFITDSDDKIMLIDVMMQFFKLVSKFPKKLRENDEILQDIYFGYDRQMRIINYINEIAVELEAELSLKIDLPTRIHLDC